LRGGHSSSQVLLVAALSLKFYCGLNGLLLLFDGLPCNLFSNVILSLLLR
jgi:hypothetical protein